MLEPGLEAEDTNSQNVTSAVFSIRGLQLNFLHDLAAVLVWPLPFC